MFPILPVRKALLQWYESGRRDLPWRRTRDPYRIWLSEIMLQQTRVAAVIPYYERFLARFPDATALAEAAESDVLAAWAGLGYYSRARNLRQAAIRIAETGGFPSSYDRIRELPGVGEYTAAAVASIAFDLPHAALDGNVLRVLSRLANDASDIASPAAKARFQQMADELLDRRKPGAFNQAMMELGATVCLPREPRCLLCPVAAHCLARAAGRQGELPVKSRKISPVRIERTVLLIERAGKLLMWQRPSGTRKLGGFWELPEATDFPDADMDPPVGEFRHSIMNHNYRFAVCPARVKRIDSKRFHWIGREQLETLPVSTAARKALAARACRTASGT